ncbi:MAG: hypothetical protein LBG83_00550 [Oscillospiraceae bacterium]|jgi:hypothetical protein|nr:hypothetical protein [Oscillospiraceae bacterium]
MTHKKKRNLTILLSVLLVAAIAVGATLAWLWASTETAENVFTFAKNITGHLDEPSWDPPSAENLTPGSEIDKDPQITNTSKNAVVEYAAIRLTWLDGAGNELSVADMTKLMTIIEIDWSANWYQKVGTTNDPQQIWIYNKTLPQGVTSDPIFYKIVIPSDTTNDEFEWMLGDYGHDDSCYAFGAHDPALCTITYRHHERCALYNGTNTEAQISTVAGGGSLGGATCDCNAVQVHEPTCPSLVGSLVLDPDTGLPACGHTTVLSGLGNFTIRVEGAVVQADTFDGLNGADPALDYADDALITLFN